MRDSFDRFGDDLCCLLLSFLDIEESFAFQCVSQQFKDTLFRNTRLVIDNKLIQKWRQLDLFGRQYVICEPLIALLKKCSFVGHIEVSQTLPIDGILAVIVSHCRCLTSIEMDFEKISSQETNDRFFATFGPKLKSIVFKTESNSLKKTSRNWHFFRKLKLCSNLLSLNMSSYHEMSTIFDNNNQIFVNNLKCFEFRCDLRADMKRFEVFVENNTSLETFRLKSISNADQKSVNLLMKTLLSFNRLRELELNFGFNYISADNPFIQSLKRLDGKYLQKFKLHLSYKRKTQLLSIMNIIKYFPHLRALELYYNRFDENRVENDCNLSLTALNRCKHLSHLRLSFESIILDDIFFDNIDIDLPNLRVLRVDSRSEITDNTLNCLAKLPKLESISLLVTKTKLTEESFEDIVNNCHKINSITIYSSKGQIFMNQEMIENMRRNV